MHGEGWRKQTLLWWPSIPAGGHRKGPLVAQAGSVDFCPVQQGSVGDCSHVPSSKDRTLLSRADKEEASL